MGSPTPAHARPRSRTPPHARPRPPTPAHACPRSPTLAHASPRSPTPAHACPRPPTPPHARPRPPTLTHWGTFFASTSRGELFREHEGGGTYVPENVSELGFARASRGDFSRAYGGGRSNQENYNNENTVLVARGASMAVLQVTVRKYEALRNGS